VWRWYYVFLKTNVAEVENITSPLLPARAYNTRPFTAVDPEIGEKNCFSKRRDRACVVPSSPPKNFEKKKFRRVRVKKNSKNISSHLARYGEEESGNPTSRTDVGAGYTTIRTAVAYSLSTGARSSTTPSTSSTASK